MAGSKFDELALQYVLADDQSKEAAAASEAANMIQSATNTRILVGQWVASINRWISPGSGASDSGLDQDLISRAKALDFLASTLEILNTDTLRADQVKLLVTFFGSLFSSDHRAGIAASAKALRQLTQMKAFQPSLASDIIESVRKLGDDFKLQVPATRLELYELFRAFLKDQIIVGDLLSRYGEGSGFMTGLIEVCRSERDPVNLMVWFDILKTFIQSFSPSDEVIAAVFKAFSAYFPISLRASTTPSGITADDLKRAVRACFASHHRLADLTIPFLLGKLDQGDAVTVAVKVDILQTIEACLAQYEEPEHSVHPYADKIWNSLKYEVRNGELIDAIEATLKVIATLTRRLNANSLRDFFNSAWTDISDDLENATYTAQAGRLLVAISGASIASFDLANSQAVPTIQYTIRSSKASGHQQDLLTILNSLLLVRTHLDYGSGISTASASDQLFGDALFVDVYQRMWEETLQMDESASEHNGLLKKLMEGMATMVSQRASNDPTAHLCSDGTCQQIVEYLAKPAITCLLTDTSLLVNSTNDTTRDVLQESAATALARAIPRFSEGFQQLLLVFFNNFEISYQTDVAAQDLPLNIQLAVATLSDIVCSQDATAETTFSTARDLTYTLLQGLSRVLETQSTSSSDQMISAFVASIHLIAVSSLQALAKTDTANTQDQITADWYNSFQSTLAESVATPDLRKSNSAQWTGTVFDSVPLSKQLLAFYVLVVQQLFKACTSMDAASQDNSLHHLGLLASSVVRSLTEKEQIALSLDRGAFTLFQSSTSLEDGKFSPLQDFRNSPLTMGILQGLYPAALNSQRHISALEDLVNILIVGEAQVANSTRAALDNTLTILTNKFQPKGAERSAKRLEIQQSIVDTYQREFGTGSELRISQSQAIQKFCSILYHLSGDVTRFQSSPTENELLPLVCEQAPSHPVLGKVLAPCFEILVSDKQCLAVENHAIRKRLSDQWVYHQAVQPFLGSCFPKADDASAGPTAESQQATSNRAVTTFALLRHMKHEHYAADIAKIVRVVVRSLNSLEVGTEMEACLSVLADILEKDPPSLKEHIGALIRGTTAVYNNSIRTAQTGKGTGRSSYALSMCRKLALDFLRRVPSSYESSQVLPHRQPLLRPLSLACGDPVREIRQLALAARQAWEGLN